MVTLAENVRCNLRVRGRPFRVVVTAVMRRPVAAARISSPTFGPRSKRPQAVAGHPNRPAGSGPMAVVPQFFALNLRDLDADADEADVVNVGSTWGLGRKKRPQKRLLEPPLGMQQAFEDSVQEPEKHPLGWQLVLGVRAFQ